MITSFHDHVLDTAWVITAEQLYKAQQLRKKYEKLEKDLMMQLQELSGHQSKSSSNFTFTRVVRKGAIDYAAIPILKTIDLEQYRKEEVVRWNLTRNYDDTVIE